MMNGDSLKKSSVFTDITEKYQALIQNNLLLLSLLYNELSKVEQKFRLVYSILHEVYYHMCIV